MGRLLSVGTQTTREGVSFLDAKYCVSTFQRTDLACIAAGEEAASKSLPVGKTLASEVVLTNFGIFVGRTTDTVLSVRLN